MNIHERIKRVRDFALNPYIEPKTHFEKAWLNSVRDCNSKSFCHWENPEKYIRDIEYHRGLSYSIKDFTNHQNIILYSGGKESFLTMKMFDYFNVPYKLATVKEVNGYDGPEINAFVDDEITHDIEIESEMFRFGAIPQYGRHLPASYYYTLLLLKKHPGAIVWLGCEYAPFEWCHQNYNMDQCDVMFSDINLDIDINGSVYSCINSIKEFEVYKIVRKHYDYDVKFSTYDNPGKKIRLKLYEDMLNFIDNANESGMSEYIWSEFDHFVPTMRIHKPLIYDFRQDIVDFVRQFSEYQKITK